MYTNKVKSVLSNPHTGMLKLRYFDNKGSIKQKNLPLKDTVRNRKKVWKEVVPVFEAELIKRSKESVFAKDKRLGTYADKLAQKFIKEKHSKEDSHRGRIKRIRGYFGDDRDLSSITELEFEEFFSDLTCSHETKKDWLVVLRGIYKLAKKANAIAVNPLRDFDIPKISGEETEDVPMPFSVDEIKQILEVTQGTQLHAYFGLSIHIGTRPEETIAIMLDKIDLDALTIYIDKAITMRNGFGPLKTSGSVRMVAIPRQTLPFIKAQMALAQSRGSKFLFSKSNGARLNDISDLRGKKGRINSWSGVLQRCGIEYRQLRQTRHTFAVQAIKSGHYTLQEIAAMLGHSSLRMLFQHYAKYLGDSHLKVSRDIDIFESLGDFLGDF